ncbi:DoxX family protein [Calidifontibacter sp. DB0510]|uniref:DoxX family protein n=1 Tax=Metallococcus carri TaxID=1656884 RepID=A0A967AWL4_9MICO|nr:DoxX family protein [Metallococcus carri]NHN54299.1 DoxX family protein [Metallococcus carri]NOP36861.1 DoxX family protein [Calidifontibacter sp. DB2511S]
MSGLSLGARGVALAFLGSGTLHLVRPQIFEPIVPRVLPRRRELVLASGVAEIACGAGLFVPRLRPYAAPATVALLAAVWPANLQMALDVDRAARRRPTARNQVMRVGTWARMPLQLPLMRWAWQARR